MKHHCIGIWLSYSYVILKTQCSLYSKIAVVRELLACLLSAESKDLPREGLISSCAQAVLKDYKWYYIVGRALLSKIKLKFIFSILLSNLRH